MGKGWAGVASKGVLKEPGRRMGTREGVAVVRLACIREHGNGLHRGRVYGTAGSVLCRVGGTAGRYTRSGCDLVEEGRNGWSFEPDDPESVERAIRAALATGVDELERMGEYAKKTVKRMTPQRSVEDLLRLVLGSAAGGLMAGTIA